MVPAAGAGVNGMRTPGLTRTAHAHANYWATGLSWARIAEEVCGDKRFKSTVQGWLRAAPVAGNGDKPVAQLVAQTTRNRLTQPCGAGRQAALEFRMVERVRARPSSRALVGFLPCLTRVDLGEQLVEVVAGELPLAIQAQGVYIDRIVLNRGQ